ncbi:hypothetical protein [Microbispora sp. H10830]|uniref:hypothetical protein n=1 Tax=Microbispora sp. H10830 TaxID=2729109 RepID=UPI00160057BB|nr:hypothetical protein [Microbispora sp. H10830]
MRGEGPSGRPEEDPRCLSWGVHRLGEPHRSGVLTDAEFSSAKKALLDRVAEP